MLQKILPQELFGIIKKNVLISELYELRIRNNSPICFLSNNGYEVLKNPYDNKAVFADKNLIDYIVCKATDASMYAFSNQIRRGYISVCGGIRIGLSGEAVLGDDGEVKTIKNFQGLVLRIPHEVKNCSSNLMNYLVCGGKVMNTLIVSPPAGGKTTLIRDIAKNLSLQPKMLNLLIVDERFELSGSVNGKNAFDVGLFSDVIVGSSKSFGFYEGIKTMRPDVILCDEVSCKEDIDALNYASASGVKVIATTHAEKVGDLLKKKIFTEVIKQKSFDRFVELSSRNGIGTIENIYDENLQSLFKRKLF